MAVGFPNVVEVEDFEVREGKPSQHAESQYWPLEFSNFAQDWSMSGRGNASSAHHLSQQSGVGALGDGITVVHTDTGFTDHPELLDGGRVRVLDARTFTKPRPSWHSWFTNTGFMWNSQDLGVSAAMHARLTSSSASVQVSATASYRLVYNDDGRDPLETWVPVLSQVAGVDYVPVLINPSHGTSTASLIMSGETAGASPREGLPDPNAFPTYQGLAAARMVQLNQPDKVGFAPRGIIGAAPLAQLLPIRVTDSVIVDSIVASNLAEGIRYAGRLAHEDLEDAKRGGPYDPTIGVISISMGWPGGNYFQNYSALKEAIHYATSQGVIICAASAQALEGVHSTLTDSAAFFEGLAENANAGADLASDAGDLARGSAAVALLAEQAMAGHPDVASYVAEFRQWASDAGKDADYIEAKARLIEDYLRQEAFAQRKFGGVGYPAADPETIACAACAVNKSMLASGFYGTEVDITAPGVDMYSAKSSNNNQGNPTFYSHQSEGTSYATAIVAGACALWQAHHGRDNLIGAVGREYMTRLFRYCLKRSCTGSDTDKDASNVNGWDQSLHGFGILDARALLEVAIPSSAADLEARSRTLDIWK